MLLKQLSARKVFWKVAAYALASNKIKKSKYLFHVTHSSIRLDRQANNAEVPPEIKLARCRDAARLPLR